jgi:hypothetical protein
MKRIIAASTLAVAACVGFTSAAKADLTAPSTHTGTVVPLCSVTSDGINKTFTQVTTVLNGVAFPTKLTSNGIFYTLCNTASSTVTLTNNGSSYPATADPSVGYQITGTNSQYVLNTADNPNPIATAASLTATHSYSTTPGQLLVAPYVEAKPGKVLEKGTYTVSILATIAAN